MSDLPQNFFACASIVLHMHKKFEVNRTKIKGGCQSYTKATPRESWSDLTLVHFGFQFNNLFDILDQYLLFTYFPFRLILSWLIFQIFFFYSFNLFIGYFMMAFGDDAVEEGALAQLESPIFTETESQCFNFFFSLNVS